jgi:hypothetical protein
VFFSLLCRRPSVNLAHMRDNTRIVWQLGWSPYYLCGLNLDGPQARWIDPDERLKPPKEWNLDRVAVPRGSPPGLLWATRPRLIWLTWRSALYMYLFFLGILVAAVRSRNARYLLVALPIVLQVLLMVLLGPGNDFRYHWGVYLVGMLTSGYLLLGVPKNAAESLSAGSATPAAADSTHQEPRLKAA